jgi:hypothetical protein
MSDLIEITAFCCECETPVNPNSCLREVVGWARPRKKGGVHHIELRRETGRFLCDHCARLLKQTGSAQQGVLAV